MDQSRQVILEDDSSSTSPLPGLNDPRETITSQDSSPSSPPIVAPVARSPDPRSSSSTAAKTQAYEACPPDQPSNPSLLLEEKLASLSLTDIDGTPDAMFRSLASLFQASQAHEGGIILNQANGSDIWTILHRADEAESRGERDVPALRSVMGVLDQMLWARSQLLLQATKIMADASRDPSWRLPFGEGGILNFALGAVASTNTSDDILIQALRLIGNSCADTDENRQRVVSNHYLQMIITRMEDPRFASVAVPVVYNICMDFEPAQKQAINAGLFPTVIRVLQSDLLFSSPALSYACRLLDICLENLDPSLSPSDSVEVLLMAALPPDLDVDDFASLVDTAVAHLKSEDFQRHIATEDFFDLPLKILLRSYFPQANLSSTKLPSISSMAAVVREPEEEAEHLRVRRSLVSALSDVSALSEFGAIHSSFDTPLIGTMTKWLSAIQPQLQLCACIVIGNLAQSDDVCSAIVERLHLHKELIAILRSSSDSTIIHSVLGFLRNLALPANNKEILGEAGAIEALTRFLSSDSLPQVSYGAACLARQLLIGNLNNSRRLLAPLSADSESPASSKTYLSLILALFEKSDDLTIKTEVARIVAALLRCFSSSESLDQSSKDEYVRHLYSLHPNIGGPLGMVVSQSKYPIVRSEGWFALALMARSTEGASIINQMISEVNIFTALEETIRGTTTDSSPRSASATGSNTPDTPDQNVARSQEMRSKDRENAMILVTELLQNGGDDDMAEPRRSALEDLLQAGSRVEH